MREKCEHQFGKPFKGSDWKWCKECGTLKNVKTGRYKVPAIRDALPLESPEYQEEESEPQVPEDTDTTPLTFKTVALRVDVPNAKGRVYTKGCLEKALEKALKPGRILPVLSEAQLKGEEDPEDPGKWAGRVTGFNISESGDLLLEGDLFINPFDEGRQKKEVFKRNHMRAYTTLAGRGTVGEDGTIGDDFTVEYVGLVPGPSSEHTSPLIVKDPVQETEASIHGSIEAARKHFSTDRNGPPKKESPNR